MVHIGQKQIVIADLEQIPLGSALLSEILVSARFPGTVTEVWNAHPAPVIVTEFIRLVQIQRVPESFQGCFLPGLVCCRPQLSEPLIQSLVADIMGFSFPDNC
jgi:hypothetical protein